MAIGSVFNDEMAAFGSMKIMKNEMAAAISAQRNRY